MICVAGLWIWISFNLISKSAYKIHVPFTCCEQFPLLFLLLFSFVFLFMVTTISFISLPTLTFLSKLSTSALLINRMISINLVKFRRSFIFVILKTHISIFYWFSFFLFRFFFNRSVNQYIKEATKCNYLIFVNWAHPWNRIQLKQLLKWFRSNCWKLKVNCTLNIRWHAIKPNQCHNRKLNHNRKRCATDLYRTILVFHTLIHRLAKNGFNATFVLKHSATKAHWKSTFQPFTWRKCTNAPLKVA